jgi:hypothetical protein
VKTEAAATDVVVRGGGVPFHNLVLPANMWGSATSSYNRNTSSHIQNTWPDAFVVLARAPIVIGRPLHTIWMMSSPLPRATMGSPATEPDATLAEATLN